jgi:hypothetical protein
MNGRVAEALDHFSGDIPMTGRAHGIHPTLRRKVVSALEGKPGGMSALDVVNRVAANNPGQRKAVKSEVRDLLNRGVLTIGSDLRLHRAKVHKG